MILPIYEDDFFGARTSDGKVYIGAGSLSNYMINIYKTNDKHK